MDRIASYKDIVKKEMELRASRKPFNLPAVERHLVIDKDCLQFVLLSTGRRGVEHVHNVLVHLQLKDGKIWIHEDRTDPGIREVLMEKGIQEKDILPVYLPDYEWEEEGVAA